MAPEQAAGRNRDVGVPTDVYALGAVLFEALTGRPPFRGETPLETMEQVRSSPPPAPSSLRPSVPRDLETICLKCLHKEPGGRYPTAEALADDLRRFRAGEPIAARRVGRAARLVMWCRRNPALAATVAAAAVLVAAVAGAGLYQVLQERERFRTERDVARVNLYRALGGEALARMKARETGWWWLAMDNLREAGRLDVPGRDATEQRELAVECMGSEFPCLRVRHAAAAHDGPVTAAACSADGRRAATGGKDGTVRLWALPGGEPLGVLTGHSRAVSGLTFLPDGRLVSGSLDGTLRVWPADGPAPPQALDVPGGGVTTLALSPDRATLAAGCADGTIRLVGLADGAAATAGRTLVGHGQAVTCLAFAPAGWLVSGGADDTVRFWNPAAGTQTRVWPVQHPPTAVAVADTGEEYVGWGDGPTRTFLVRRVGTEFVSKPDGVHGGGVTALLVTAPGWVSASTDGVIRVWRYTTSRLHEQVVAREEYGGVAALAITPGTETVVAGCQTGRVVFWELASPPHRVLAGGPSHNAVLNADGTRVIDARSLVTLSGDGSAPATPYAPLGVEALAVRPDGGAFALGRLDGTLEVHRLPAAGAPVVARGHARAVTALAAGSDGRFASASLDGTVKLWAWDSAAADRTIDPGVGAVHAVA